MGYIYLSYYSKLGQTMCVTDRQTATQTDPEIADPMTTFQLCDDSRLNSIR